MRGAEYMQPSAQILFMSRPNNIEKTKQTIQKPQRATNFRSKSFVLYRTKPPTSGHRCKLHRNLIAIIGGSIWNRWRRFEFLICMYNAKMRLPNNHRQVDSIVLNSLYIWRTEWKKTNCSCALDVFFYSLPPKVINNTNNNGKKITLSKWSTAILGKASMWQSNLLLVERINSERKKNSTLTITAVTWIWWITRHAPNGTTPKQLILFAKHTHYYCNYLRTGHELSDHKLARLSLLQSEKGIFSNVCPILCSSTIFLNSLLFFHSLARSFDSMQHITSDHIIMRINEIGCVFVQQAN